MAEIAKPITSLFPTAPIPTATQIDKDFEVLFGEYLRRARLIHGLGFPVDDELERFGAVGWDEADGCSGRDDGFCGRETLRVADGAEDAAPVGVFAVQGRFDQGVAGDGCSYEFRVWEGGGVDHFDADEFGGTLAVPDD